MAFQFDNGNPVYCVGIERNALHNAGEYNVLVGKEQKNFVISYQQALDLVQKYGESKIFRKFNGKDVFIVPVRDFVK